MKMSVVIATRPYKKKKKTVPRFITCVFILEIVIKSNKTSGTRSGTLSGFIEDTNRMLSHLQEYITNLESLLQENNPRKQKKNKNELR